MDIRDIALCIDLPTSASWEFGGHLYGLEPLALPMRWQPRIGSADGSEAQTPLSPQDSAWSPDAEGAELTPADQTEINRLFWFRWITGHQTTFCLWQLLASVLSEAAEDDGAQNKLARTARSLVRGYSLMLLYTSSPPRKTYEDVIRAPMARQHPNLSGSWARDYVDVRSLLRGRISIGTGEQAAAVARECRLNDQVHHGIALRVVPSGVSLLQVKETRKSSRQLRRETLLWLYDAIFLTSRADVAQEMLVRQLIRRLHAIFLDVSANGLYLATAPNPDAEPEELLSEDVAELKSGFADEIRTLATLAADLEARDSYQRATL